MTTNRTRTTEIKADLEIAGDFDRSVEIVITSDTPVTPQIAIKIMAAFYPNHKASDLTLGNVGE